MHRFLTRALRAEPHELPALAWAFAYFFLLLSSYYVLRPVRDALAVELGAQALKQLFTVTLAAMLALVPVFGWLASRLPRARLLPAVYAFFVVNLLVVSVFWSFMSDIFDTRQAARLYGTIAAGGSCGAIAGPLIAALVPQSRALLIVSALLLAATVVCIRALARWARAHPRAAEPPPEAPLGGSILAGARAP